MIKINTTNAIDAIVELNDCAHRCKLEAGVDIYRNIETLGNYINVLTDLLCEINPSLEVSLRDRVEEVLK